MAGGRINSLENSIFLWDPHFSSVGLYARNLKFVICSLIDNSPEIYYKHRDCKRHINGLSRSGYFCYSAFVVRI